jgi:hypothetical protein
MLGLVGLSCALSGCFLFYDSRWGQAKASQKRVAAHAMPAQLRVDPQAAALARAGEPTRPVERLRLRAYATPGYAAALVDGEAQLTQTVRDANPELAQDLSFRLELVDYRVWPAAVSDDDLSALLKAIAKEDSAADVDWVLVLASPRHMVAVEPDQLGVGQLIGKYLAIRAMSDAEEFDVIERGFDELSEDEKAKLYAARKRHKAATVFLHEIGHTLGMPHELDQQSLMSPRYNPQSTAFSPTAARLGRRVLELRSATPGTALERQGAQAALNVLRSAPAHTWEAGTAAEVEKLLEFRLARAPVSVSPPRAALSAEPPRSPPRFGVTPNALTAADRALFERARAAEAAGNVADARTIAAPLFEAYPNLLAVQELRCQLAMKAQLTIEGEQAECRPLMRLSGSAL